MMIRAFFRCLLTFICFYIHEISVAAGEKDSGANAVRAIPHFVSHSSPCLSRRSTMTTMATTVRLVRSSRNHFPRRRFALAVVLHASLHMDHGLVRCWCGVGNMGCKVQKFW